MRVLLDTQVWLWMLSAPERLGPAAIAVIEDRRSDVLLSAVSSWEIAIKYRLGKLPLPEAPEKYVPERMRLTGVGALPIEHSHALAVADLPDHHRDPFDRLLIAQARVERVPIVSADEQFAAYDVEVIDATS